MNLVALKRLRYRNLTLSLVWILIIISKLFQFTILPSKYFYDSTAILGYLNYVPDTVGTAYRATAAFFRFINIFGFSTLEAWAIFISAIFGVITFLLIKNNTSNVGFLTFVYLGCSVFLLGIFVFNISKDILQYSLFLITFLVIKKASHSKRYLYICVCAVIFVLESIFFREYYILVSVFSIMFFAAFDFIREGKVKIKSRAIYIIGIVFVALIIFMVSAKLLMPDEYSIVMTVRSKVNQHRIGSTDATTMITAAVDSNGNLFLWLLNYAITSIRMLFPIELLLKSPIYLPYIILQIILSHYLLKACKNITKFKDTPTVMAISVFLAFLVVSFVFEPDFGSWVRHESTSFPITMLFINQLNNTIPGQL